MPPQVTALAGGVGGAKLSLGLFRALAPERLAIVVNTGDDEEFHGLHVSPDLDTMLYTLSGLANAETGWGVAGDTFQALGMLRRYGADAWFNLGDKDLATHIRRTQRLREGATLTQVTAELCRSLGVLCRMLPMSDQPVCTVIDTAEGPLPMQRYFVQRRSEPEARAIRYQGVATARPTPEVLEALRSSDLLVFCPSNPFLSLAPILAVPGLREAVCGFKGRRVAVSPIVGGAALRGPAAKLLAELGHEVSCLGVARQYVGLCDEFLIDPQDAALAPAIAELGMAPVVVPIIMTTEEDKVKLARFILDGGA